jgi:hypothetical protein
MHKEFSVVWIMHKEISLCALYRTRACNQCTALADEMHGKIYIYIYIYDKKML